MRGDSGKRVRTRTAPFDSLDRRRFQGRRRRAAVAVAEGQIDPAVLPDRIRGSGEQGKGVRAG
jgi:hypothetical protein